MGSILYLGDCLEELENVQDNYIDLIFLDLPYGQTSCKWDCLIDLDKLWKEIMRVKKLHTPIIFTCTTKFGVSLIQSAPKKCPFRYDLVWCKSASCGFLSAKKMPLRKHEMIYVFYEKLPFYDLSSHKHKFIDQSKNNNKINDKQIYNSGRSMKVTSDGKGNQYDPPLPNSLVKEEKVMDAKTYGTKERKKPIKIFNEKKVYDPPLPDSLVKIYKKEHETAYGNNIHHHNKEQKKGESIYDPPLPNSLIKNIDDNCYGGACMGEVNADKEYKKLGRKGGESAYDPPLPTSLLKDIDNASGGGEVSMEIQDIEPEPEIQNVQRNNTTYGDVNIIEIQQRVKGESRYDPPLPTSVLKNGEVKKTLYGDIDELADRPHVATYDPPLPDSLLEIKSKRGNHSTEKPVDLMKWILKYYSKEDDIVLDATMGSGSMGVACIEMNRNFIGIEKDEKIYEVAVNRIEK